MLLHHLQALDVWTVRARLVAHWKATLDNTCLPILVTLSVRLTALEVLLLLDRTVVIVVDRGDTVVVGFLFHTCCLLAMLN